MEMFGKGIRLERIVDRKTGNAVIVPMDHGVSVGPVAGLIDMKDTVEGIVEGGATAVLMHKGLIGYGHRQSGRDVGLIMHLSASTDLAPTKNSKVLVATVEEAIKYGADAVSIHVNFGSEDEPMMLEQAGEISRKCSEWVVMCTTALAATVCIVLQVVRIGQREVGREADAVTDVIVKHQTRGQTVHALFDNGTCLVVTHQAIAVQRLHRCRL